MNYLEAKQKEEELVKLLQLKYPDLTGHIDIIEATNEIVISFFWNRLTIQKWNDAISFKCKNVDYQTTLQNKILPYFNISH